MGSTTIIPWIRHGVGATYGGSKMRLAQFLMSATGNSNIFTFGKGKKTSLKIPLKRKYVTRWWFQPIWKNMSQNGFIFPKVWGEHKKCFSCHHPGELAGGVPFLESNSSHPKKRWMAWKTRSCWNRRGAFLGNKARWCWWKKSQTTTVWMYKTPWK